MIEVTVKVFPPTGPVVEKVLARIRIENTMKGDPETGSYEAVVIVDHGDSVARYTRVVSGFRRKKYNALALLKLVLDQLTEEELDLDGRSEAADMAWRQRAGSSKVQRLLNQLHHH